MAVDSPTASDTSTAPEGRRAPADRPMTFGEIDAVLLKPKAHFMSGARALWRLEPLGEPVAMYPQDRSYDHKRGAVREFRLTPLNAVAMTETGNYARAGAPILEIIRHEDAPGLVSLTFKDDAKLQPPTIAVLVRDVVRRSMKVGATSLSIGSSAPSTIDAILAVDVASLKLPQGAVFTATSDLDDGYHSAVVQLDGTMTKAQHHWPPLNPAEQLRAELSRVEVTLGQRLHDLAEANRELTRLGERNAVKISRLDPIVAAAMQNGVEDLPTADEARAADALIRDGWTFAIDAKNASDVRVGIAPDLYAPFEARYDDVRAGSRTVIEFVNPRDPGTTPRPFIEVCRDDLSFDDDRGIYVMVPDLPGVSTLFRTALVERILQLPDQLGAHDVWIEAKDLVLDEILSNDPRFEYNGDYVYVSVHDLL